MVKTILVYLDGTLIADSALDCAATLARSCGARIVLARATQVAVIPDCGAGDSRDGATRPDPRNEEALQRLRDEGRLAEVRMPYGDPAHTILDAAHHHRASLIVMPTCGRARFPRSPRDLVADEVLRLADVPILLVPPVGTGAWVDGQQLDVLVPLDGSPAAELTLGSAEVLARTLGARIVLLRVVDPPGSALRGDGYLGHPFDEDAALESARAYLQGHEARLSARGHQIDVRVAVGRPADAIARAAGAPSVAAVILPIRGRTASVRPVLGGATAAALERPTRPVLLVPPMAGHLDLQDGPAPSRAAGVDLTTPIAPRLPATSDGGVDIHLSVAELELIERGLRALAHVPGQAYGNVLEAKLLARRLEHSVDPGLHLAEPRHLASAGHA